MLRSDASSHILAPHRDHQRSFPLMAKRNPKIVEPKLEASAISSLVDQIGLLKAHLAPQLEKLESMLKKLKDQGVDVYTGDLYEVNVFEQTRNTLDMDAVR